MSCDHLHHHANNRLMYVHRRREQEEEGNAAAVMLPMEKVLQLKAVKVVSRTTISPSSPESGSRFQRLQQIIARIWPASSKDPSR